MIPLRDNIPSQTFPVTTVFLIITNSLVFFYELSLGPQLNDFISQYGVVPHRIELALQSGSLHNISAFFPIFSSIFIHGGWLHIIGNMWFLWIFGDNVEDRMGHFGFLIFYLLSGVFASFGHVLLNSASTAPTIGASGAIAGVMGAYFILYPRAKVLTLLPIFIFIQIFEIRALLFLGFWFLLQFFYGAASLTSSHQGGGTAWWAHLGGFAAGVVMVFIFVRSKRRQFFKF